MKHHRVAHIFFAIILVGCQKQNTEETTEVLAVPPPPLFPYPEIQTAAVPKTWNSTNSEDKMSGRTRNRLATSPKSDNYTYQFEFECDAYRQSLSVRMYANSGIEAPIPWQSVFNSFVNQMQFFGNVRIRHDNHIDTLSLEQGGFANKGFVDLRYAADHHISSKDDDANSKSAPSK